ncbi:hypothetical protein KG088_10505 [Halomonas sp. TRM85114]|uniref:hypothetical protein n=1 Tax=Halomonas jincaotanensis TaxID=2810616 RepID=UPI001BD4A0CE|nr:hypothetical protein [Halomonas jincaotanensis]MBS9404061.1 hypothetical protein [Halomonas jincaotanensis]
MSKPRPAKKRVLIVSNNVLSTQNNNGKTLLSIFKSVPKECVAQLYFSSEVPEKGLASSYYRISDSDVLKSILSRPSSRRAGGEALLRTSDFEGVPYSKPIVDMRSIRDFEVSRIVRELVWKLANWKHVGLVEWVTMFNPDVVFFCAGDSVFAYRVYDIISSLTPSSIRVVYVTDDYVLPRRRISPFWWFRRHIVYSNMKKAVVSSDVFVTISKEMRNEYKKRFGKDSINIFNAPKDLKVRSFKKTPRKDYIMVYAGGLHFERWKTLHELALAIKKFNEKNGRSVVLKVFSHQSLDKKIVNSLNVSGSAEFCGPLDVDGVKFQLNDADILVHVESFNRKCIESTRLSISTKIGEYLSVGSPILAIGPQRVASMKFLKDTACCITSRKSYDSALYNILAENCTENDQINHNPVFEDNVQLFEDLVLFDATVS